MDYVTFYNPNLAHKPSHAQPKISVVKKHRPPLQAIKSQPATSLQNAQVIRQPIEANKASSTEYDWRLQSKGCGALRGGQGMTSIL